MTAAAPAIQWYQGPIVDRQELADNVLVAVPGKAILFGVTSAGTVTVTLASGAALVLNLASGDNMYPFGALKYTADGLSPATVANAYNLY